MKLSCLIFTAVFVSLFFNEAHAQTLSNPESEVKKLFNEFIIAFNAKDSEKITRTFFRTPVTLRQGENVSLVTTSEDAIRTLENLFGQIEQKGWTKSKVIRVDLCVISETLVFLDNEYSRLKEDGTAIEPAIRRTLQVWQKLKDEWRIVAFYFHDPSVRIGCKK